MSVDSSTVRTAPGSSASSRSSRPRGSRRPVASQASIRGSIPVPITDTSTCGWPCTTGTVQRAPEDRASSKSRRITAERSSGTSHDAITAPAGDCSPRSAAASRAARRPSRMPAKGPASGVASRTTRTAGPGDTTCPGAATTNRPRSGPTADATAAQTHSRNVRPWNRSPAFPRVGTASASRRFEPPPASTMPTAASVRGSTRDSRSLQTRSFRDQKDRKTWTSGRPRRRRCRQSDATDQATGGPRRARRRGQATGSGFEEPRFGRGPR